MGNQATKVSDSASATASSIKKRLTIRRRRPETVDDFTAEDIQKKIDGIPVLTNQEISVLKSSWELIAKKIEIAGAHTFLPTFDRDPKCPDNIERHCQRVMSVVGGSIELIDDHKSLWKHLISLGREHFADGALPMYFDKMGPHFVIVVRSSLADNWYEALEYHWLAFFNIVTYIMKFGWHLQRADVQNKARSQSSGIY